MSDIMRPIPFENLLNRILKEFTRTRKIFGLPFEKFFFKKNDIGIKIFGDFLETPLGPAAGPHTQLAQNIVVSYLAGGRFFELKTVQKLDRLKIDKPCIEAEDEGYNVEWSQELTLEQSYREYVKAWFLISFLKELFGFSRTEERGFIFNMSVGYDLEGIKTPGMERFINELIDASSTELFSEYQKILMKKLDQREFNDLITGIAGNSRRQTTDRIKSAIENISPNISSSVTVSTMHGCPPDEIEAICRYLIGEKGLHTYVKLNPTLLGFEKVRSTLDRLGYKYIELDRKAFDHDLQYSDAVPMIRRLQEFAASRGKQFGIKLSNTLGMKNVRKRLPGEEMYMSGRALFPLTVALACELGKEFDGRLQVSYSGGASHHNVERILKTGIYPVTMVTDLLKPGGYARLLQMTEKVEALQWTDWLKGERLNIKNLENLVKEAQNDPYYRKERREIDSIKLRSRLPRFDCYVSPCREICPIHQDVSEYIRLVKEERYLEAFKVIVETNPLPHITGYICDHKCMDHCTRWDYESPVYIREMKKVAAEKAYSEFMKKYGRQLVPPSNGIEAAVIGAGPAGLSAAYFLAKAGFKVTVFEKNERAGGVVQNVIPDFRLPQYAIDRDVEFIRSHGVQFRFGVKEDFSIEALKNEGFKYIFLAIGAGKSRKLRLKKGNESVIDALDFLRDFNSKNEIKLGERVAVTGGGNSAMDAARAALRVKGVKEVTIIYRRTKEFMPADREEFDAAVAEGVVFRELLLPVEFESGQLKCQKMILGERDEDGRRKALPLEGEFEVFQIDSLISAIGEQVEDRHLIRNGIRPDHNQKIVVNDETNETCAENVFIGGDALRGPSTVVESVADGKKAAEAIMKKENLSPGFGLDFNEMFDPAQRIADINRRKGMILPFQKDDPLKEAARCLECNLICDKCVEVCPNRANVAIAVPSKNGDFKDMFQILHIDSMCNECGNCETFCPYRGAPYKDKITLFRNEEDFENSSNEGFCLLSDKDNLKFKVRYSSKTGHVFLNENGAVLKSDWEEDDQSFKRILQMMVEIIKNHDYLIADE
ncbi:MAG: putative selenate reductase subunit YgfK [Calditrichaeota bacterium]|nr:putative selenate reductase subunit YgfK [Calditrichota bacterium]